VPGHRGGVDGNEVADQLARQGSSNITCNPHNNPFVCKSEKVVFEAKNIYKLLCIMVKVCKANVCKMRGVYMRMNQCLGGMKGDHAPAVCVTGH